MAKKIIKIKFTDLPYGFTPENSVWIKLLSERYKVVLAEDADFLIYSVFGNDHLKYNCIKIFWTGECQSPDFNLCDYAIGFDYLEYGDRYLRVPNYYLSNPILFDQIQEKVHSTTDTLQEKTSFCSFVYSNNHASPERQQFFHLLSAYKPISSGGRFLNNIGGAVSDKLSFQKSHKFAIAFENSSSPGYTTEKLPHAFAAHTVPIYWGDPLVGQHFNTDSFINCHDYTSFEEVVEKIKLLNKDDEAYLKMLQTPALNRTNDYNETLAKLRTFLFPIFDQEPENAKRYNREYWGRKYQKKQCEIWNAYNWSPKGIAGRFYMYVFRKIEKKNKSVWLWKTHKGLMKLLGKS